MSNEFLNSLKGQLQPPNKVDVVSLRLDRQLTPYLHVHGSIGKVNSTTEVAFSKLGLGMSDLVIDNEGTVYGAGATLIGKYARWIPSLHYSHNRVQIDNQKGNDTVVNTVVPSVGLLTDYGVVNLGVVYQDVEVTYSGEVTTPFVGAVPLTVTTKNSKSSQVVAGVFTQLAKDFYVQANTSLGGQQRIQLQINKRF